MKYILFIFLIVGTSRPSVEPMFYEEELYGAVVREGVKHYEEDGKIVYFIDIKRIKALAELPYKK